MSDRPSGPAGPAGYEQVLVESKGRGGAA